MKVFLATMLIAACLCNATVSQQVNSNFATLTVDQSAADAVGEGTREVEVFTETDTTMRMRGLPLQPFALITGDYQPNAVVVDTHLRFDLGLDTISPLIDGFGVPHPDRAMDSAGNHSQTAAFSGLVHQSDLAFDVQGLVGNPISLFGITTTAVTRVRVIAGYKEHVLASDDAVVVPFRGGMTFSFYGHTYDRVWVTSNGRVTFGAPLDVSALDMNAFNEGPPAVAGFYHDFDPTAAPGTTISTSQYKVGEEWYFHIRYDSLQEQWSPGVFFDFDVILMPQGIVQINIGDRLNQPLGYSIVGITPGGYQPTGLITQSAVPRAADLSAALGTFSTFSGDGPVFEHFFNGNPAFSPEPPMDLLGKTITFYPTVEQDSALPSYAVN